MTLTVTPTVTTYGLTGVIAGCALGLAAVVRFPWLLAVGALAMMRPGPADATEPGADGGWDYDRVIAATVGLGMPRVVAGWLRRPRHRNRHRRRRGDRRPMPRTNARPCDDVSRCEEQGQVMDRAELRRVLVEERGLGVFDAGYGLRVYRQGRQTFNDIIVGFQNGWPTWPGGPRIDGADIDECARMIDDAASGPR